MKPKQKDGHYFDMPKITDEQLKKILPVVDDKDSIVKEKKKHKKTHFWNRRGISYLSRRRLKKKPSTSFLIRMKFSNGTSKEFVISTTKETFTYMKRTYYLRYEDSWFNLTQNQYELDYFDDHPVPLDRSIVKLGDKAYWSVTSDNLKPIIQMEYVKALASSSEIDKWLRATASLSLVMMFMLIALLWITFAIKKAVVVV